MLGLIATADVEKRFSDYAYPLLYTFRRASDTPPDNVGRMEKLLYETFEVTLKYVALCLAAKYKSDGLQFPEIDRQLKGLLHPSAGKYSSLLRDLLGLYAQLNDPFAEEIERFYQHDLDDPTFAILRELSKQINFPTPPSTGNVKQLLDVLVGYRNRVWGHGATTDRDEAEARITALSHLLAVLFERLRFLAKLRLVWVDSVERAQGREVVSLRVWNGQSSRHDKIDSDEIDPSAGLQPDRLYLETGRPEGKPAYVDFSPWLTVVECRDSCGDQVALLNNARQKKLEYLSYQCGHTVPLTPRDYAFDALAKEVATLEPSDGGAGLPPHLRERLQPNEESKTLRKRAQASLADDDVEGAINFLRHAIKRSPLFPGAVRELADLLTKHDRSPEARKVIDDYLRLEPEDVEMLRHSATQASSMEPDDDKDLRALPLAYEFLFFAVFGTRRHLGKALALVLALAVAAGCALFSAQRDNIMALTICSMGVFWAATLWATWRTRKLLASSRPNFAAFLRTDSGGEEFPFIEMTRPVFLPCPDVDRGESRAQPEDWEKAARRMGTGRALLAALKDNWRRAMLVFAGAAVGTVWIFGVSKHSAEGWSVDVFFALFSFLALASFCYLISCIVKFHRLLRDLKFQSIQFSLVQHPKLSIRYLSHLSRRVSYPLILVYISAIFTVYLGPFIANVAFVGVLTVMVLLICFFYYSTIFIVRSVILRNKWKLIARFSVHFDTPFNRLIRRADPADMKRLRELLEMRDFIDSMNVWAEKKSVLIAAAFLYLGVVLFATVGLSNSMTQTIVPWLAQVLDEASDRDEPIPPIQLPSDAVGSPVAEVRVQDVDDTVIVFWGDSLVDILAFANRMPTIREQETFDDGAVSYRRDDWRDQVHAELKESIPLGAGKAILVVCYNKVFHGDFGLGGGKFSQDVRVEIADRTVLTSKLFIRRNDRGVKYAALLELTVEEGAVSGRLQENGRLPQSVQGFLKQLEAELKQEADARTIIFGRR